MAKGHYSLSEYRIAIRQRHVVLQFRWTEALSLISLLGNKTNYSALLH